MRKSFTVCTVFVEMYRIRRTYRSVATVVFKSHERPSPLHINSHWSQMEKISKRKRATVLARKDGQILLVQERGRNDYSLPGGGIEHGEPSLLAAVRELYEETRLKASSIHYLDDIEGQRALHYVFVADVYGQIRLQRREIARFRWWDGKESLPLQGHVKRALALLRKSEGN